MLTNRISIVSKAPATGFTNTQSVEFDGEDDRITIGDSAVLDCTSGLTVAFWHYLGDMNDLGTDGDGDIFLKADAYRAFWTTGGGERQLKFRVYGDETSTLISDNISGTGTDAWGHFVFTYENTAGSGSDEMRIYQNGSEIKNTTSVNTGNLTTNTSDIDIAGTVADNRQVKGKLDEFAIWNEVLDADAVTAIYNSGVPFDLTEDNGDYDEYTDGLVCYLRFEGDFNDSSGNGNTVTVHNEAALVTDTP